MILHISRPVTTELYRWIFSDLERAQHFGRKEAASKKKRKSRTAFTNAQIFELEKRFLYQKYLSPADRDEIALGLGLSNGQVSYQIVVFWSFLFHISYYLGDNMVPEQTS